MIAVGVAMSHKVIGNVKQECYGSTASEQKECYAGIIVDWSQLVPRQLGMCPI